MKERSHLTPVLIAIFWTALSAGLGFVLTRSVSAEWRSRFYSRTMGAVQSSELVKHSGSKPTYAARIVYRYGADGRQLTGNRLRYGSEQSPSRSQVQEIVDRYPVNAQVPVYFDPAFPLEATLETGVTGPSLLMTLFVIPFIALMLHFWAKLFTERTKSKKTLVAEDVEVLQGDGEIRARLPRSTAMRAGLLTLGYGPFVAAFFAGMAGDAGPSVRAVMLYWALILGAAISVFLWRWLRIRSGAEDLVIDERAGTLKLPQTFKRQKSAPISINEFQQIEVEYNESRTLKGTPIRKWAPVLHLKEGGRRERLAEWRSPEKANAFAAWVGEKTELPAKPWA